MDMHVAPLACSTRRLAMAVGAGAAGGLARVLRALPWAFPLLATSGLTVLCGARRSVPEEDQAEEDRPEAMSTEEAMRFPLVGSAVLVTLFACFKFFSKEMVNKVLALYFVALGVLSLTGLVHPFAAPLFPRRVRAFEFRLKSPKVPYVLDPPLDQPLDGPTLVLGALSSAFCLHYYVTRHWLSNNILGVAFSVTGIELLPLGSTWNGLILLWGLFFYDIFWVFFTPVMVSVARNFDAPIKLLFPRTYWGETPEGEHPFSMLGLGDIVLPGLYLALMMRYDAERAKGGRVGGYFRATMGGYLLGLVATLVVMTVFNAAQPALLYIVPGVTAASFGLAWRRGELAELYNWEEEEPEDDEDEQKGDAEKKED